MYWDSEHNQLSKMLAKGSILDFRLGSVWILNALLATQVFIQIQEAAIAVTSSKSKCCVKYEWRNLEARLDSCILFLHNDKCIDPVKHVD